jgi:hypothetical protein
MVTLQQCTRQIVLEGDTSIVGMMPVVAREL